METSFVDLHVHPALPFIGRSWRRMQGFRLPAFDGKGAAPAPFRLHVLAQYQTFLLRPGAARERLFRSLERLGALAGGPGSALIRSASDLASWHRGGDGYRQGYVMAVESLRYIRDPGDLGKLWALGVRSLQPVHFLDTPWGHSSLEGILPPSSKGLSGLGREMLAEMGALGFILDLAHMNVPTAEECLARHAGPVMCSHTGLGEIRPTARNLPAELAREVFRRGGAVGVTCWRRLLAPFRAGGRDERAAWTRSFCSTATALAALFPGARVSVGSDRGAPIRAPGWFFSGEHLREIEAELAAQGWDEGGRRGFLSGNALGFLSGSLPA